MKDIKDLLDAHYSKRDTAFELSVERPDPLMVVKANLNSENLAEIALVCALFAYGNVRAIIKMLNSLDFSLLGAKDGENLIKSARFPLYRFQSSEDVRAVFLCLHQIIQNGGIKRVFVESYARENSVIEGINAMIETMRANVQMTRGLDFLIGRKCVKAASSSPLKRWNLLLRWLVRKDNIDIGVWSDSVSKKDLILPLDTHTFRVSREIGLLKRKSYDLQSAIEITQMLKKFAPNDPIKYDFALYRIGQEKLLGEILR